MSEQPVSTIESGARLSRRQIAGYGIALLSASAAFVSTMLLQHLFPYPFLFLFFGAVMASAWFGGTAAGLFAVLISTAVVAYYFVPPFYSWTISATAEAYFVSFVVCALVASWVSSSKKKSEAALRETRDQLEIRVSERTAELMKTQAELAHLSRVLSMGELTASIAHELSQPLTAVVAHGNACVEWLSAAPPNLEKARQTAKRIVQDGTQAGAVLSRIRALFKKEAPAKDWF
jgi:K+-sensing histidine kinase KdpD